MRVYIAGPITNVLDYKDKFKEVADKVLEDGHYVMNPAILPDGFEYVHYMNICIEMLRSCEKVVFLPGWKDSKGAGIEHVYASLWEKEIEYL